MEFHKIIPFPGLSTRNHLPTWMFRHFILYRWPCIVWLPCVNHSYIPPYHIQWLSLGKRNWTHTERKREREKCRICFAIIDLNPISNPSNGRLLQVLWQTFGQKLTFTKHRLSHTYARVTKWIFPMNSNEWIEHISLIMMKVERIFFFIQTIFLCLCFFSLYFSLVIFGRCLCVPRLICRQWLMQFSTTNCQWSPHTHTHTK